MFLSELLRCPQCLRLEGKLIEARDADRKGGDISGRKEGECLWALKEHRILDHHRF